MEKQSIKPTILAAGTYVVDYHKTVKHYPNERASSKITGEVISNGGAPLNLLVDLAKLGTRANLKASGRIAQDLDGKFIVETANKHGIDISQLNYDKSGGTGYTDVFTVEESGRHTCFHFAGVGGNFSRQDVKLDVAKPDYLFLGSLGALGQLEAIDPESGRAQSTKLIRDARKRGITTIIEFAPLDQGASISDFAETLAESDYVIINDRVAETITQMSLYSDNIYDPDLARKAAQKILDTGLRIAVIIHSGAGAVYVGADGSFYKADGYFLPWAERSGSAGVDHAFCAGFIDGLVGGKDEQECLRRGLAVSTVCRKDLTPSNSIGSMDSCLKFCELSRASQ
ncbi:carbohydrate kinase family protein [Coraliomargarita sp. W4R72]